MTKSAWPDRLDQNSDSQFSAAQNPDQEIEAVAAIAPTVPPRRSLSLSTLLVGIGAGMLLTLAGTRLIGADRSPETSDQPAASAPTATQTVTTTPVQQATIQDQLAVNGTVEPLDLLEIAPQVSGLQIRQVRVREGDRVTAGQVLASLDDATLQADLRQQQAQLAVAQATVVQKQAALSQAQATLREAQQDLVRSQTLAERGAISQQELTRQQTQTQTSQEAVGVARAEIDSAEAGVRSQQAAIDRLQTQLGQTSVYAPAAGIIAKRSATVGDVSATGTPLFSLIQNNRLELAADVPQVQLNQVNIGAPVTITPTSDAGIQLQGTVRDINPLVDAATRIATVNISLPASDLLRPGMFLQATILTGSRQGLVVPSTATLPQANGQTIVYVLSSDHHAVARTVTLGQRLPASSDQPARVEVVQGLQAGEQVIVTGAGYVQDGDLVTVVSDQVGGP